MNCPIILLIPVFMFIDYYFTIWGSVLRDKGHSKHFELPNYELNPIWQADIQKKKIVNLRFFGGVVITFLPALFLTEFFGISPRMNEFLSGLILVHFGLLIGRHLSNIFSYVFVIHHEGAISGRVRIGYDYMLHSSMYQYLVAILPIVMLTVYLRTWFMFGCVTAAAGSAIMHLSWIRKHRKNKTASSGGPVPQPREISNSDPE